MLRSKSKIQTITGLDLGSTAIRVAVGQYTHSSGEPLDIRIVGVVEVPSLGVHKGAVVSIEETVSSISHALEQTERLVGIPIEHAWIGISGTHIQFQQSKGVVAVAKADGEISAEDVERALDSARSVAAPLNYEVLHVLTRSFAVDGQSGIKDPIGMTGIRLEADVQMIHGSTSQLKNITKAVYRTGIDIDDLVLSILVTADVVTTSRQKDLGVAVVNIGGATTSLVVYENGEMITTAMFPIGSDHITNDIAIGLRTSIDVAERVKLQWASCLPKQYSKKEVVDIAEAGAEYHENVSLQYVAEIVEARVCEIMEKIDEEFARVNKSGLLPAGVVFTGGGAKLPGLVDLAKETLRLPATLGYPIELASSSEKVQDVAFTTAIGLVRWAAQLAEERGHAVRSKVFSMGKYMDKLKAVAKSLIP